MNTEARLTAELASRNLTTADIDMTAAVEFVNDIENSEGVTITYADEWDNVINSYSANGLVIC